MTAEAGSDAYEATISLIGGRNQNAPADTICLFDCNQNTQMATDMNLYQFFRISGVAVKMFFPQPTDVSSSPVQWTCAYSANEIMLPAIAPDRVQCLASYQTGSCSQGRPITRYYNTSNALRRLGIQYCDTQEFNNFGAIPAIQLYGRQLPVNAGSSVNVKVYRQDTAITDNALGRLQVTYYVTYKGNKGTSSLVNP